MAKGRKKGFTLAELLVASTLVAIVMGSVYTAFYSSIRIWRLGEENMNAYQDARIASNMVRNDLVRMMPYSWHLFEGDDSEFGFYTITPPLDVETGVIPRIMWVHYEVKKDGDGALLERDEQPVEGPLPLQYPGMEEAPDIKTKVDLGDKETFTVSTNILKMKVEYIWLPAPPEIPEGGAPTESEAEEEAATLAEPVVKDEPMEDWDKPQAMRITFLVHDTREEKETTTFTAYIPFNGSPPTLTAEDME